MKLTNERQLPQIPCQHSTVVTIGMETFESPGSYQYIFFTPAWKAQYADIGFHTPIQEDVTDVVSRAKDIFLWNSLQKSESLAQPGGCPCTNYCVSLINLYIKGPVYKKR